MKRSTLVWLIVLLIGIAVLFFLPLATLLIGRQAFGLFPGMMRGFGMMGRGGFGIFNVVGIIFRLVQFGALVLVIVAGVGLISSLIGIRRPEPTAVVNTTTTTATPVQPSTPAQVCPNCGRPVQADWKLCPHCGQQLQETL